MTAQNADVVVAGHICLDIIPSLPETKGGLSDLLAPGALVRIAGSAVSTGGAVSNTGLALVKLGASVKLMGKIGNDMFGRAVVDFVNGYDPSLGDGMVVDDSSQTSHTVVVSAPGLDRSFIHCPGANDTFSADDIDYDGLAGVRLFHFGYPSLMEKMYENDGADLEKMFRQVKACGVSTSLDTAFVDPDSPSGQVDWRGVLQRTLPYVDVFVPSIDEVLAMLDPGRFESMQRAAAGLDITTQVDGELLAELSDRILAMGAAAVMLKLGDQGAYLRTSSDASRLDIPVIAGKGDVQQWCGREIISPCFQVDVAGTTGAGDCTIAGFLQGMLEGMDPVDAMTLATGTGACNVEAPDATSGIRTSAEIHSRLQTGWVRRGVDITLGGWQTDAATGAMIGPNDKTNK